MVRRKLEFGEIILTEDRGGELGEAISKLQGLEFRCTMGSHGRNYKGSTLDEFRGYRHPDGLADKDGNKYWLYWACPTGRCNHDWSYVHLLNHIQWRKEGEVRKNIHIHNNSVPARAIQDAYDRKYRKR